MQKVLSYVNEYVNNSVLYSELFLHYFLKYVTVVPLLKGNPTKRNPSYQPRFQCSKILLNCLPHERLPLL